jgi:Cu(I)/Ag(I) efflux system membrane fusion protein
MNNNKIINMVLQVRGLYMKILYLFSIIIFTILIGGCSGKKSDQTINQKNPQKFYYTCTMHPQIHLDKPGNCPICGMELIKKTESQDNDNSPKDMEGMISLSKNRITAADVLTIKAKNELMNSGLKAYSYMDFAEDKKRTIAAKFSGRIEKLFVNKTGDNIHKGQALFEIYSADLVQAQNDYLSALNNSNINNSIYPNLNSDSFLKSARKKLELYGLNESQIKDIEIKREIKYTLVYYSPVSGIVIDKKVQEGMYVSEGTNLYDVADLSSLWNIAEVYENNLANIKVGMVVKLSIDAFPGEEFAGKVKFIYPVVNAQNRTIKIRSEFSNKTGKLKPQMYGNINFIMPPMKGLFIPEDAVLFTGKRNIVWIKTSDKMFEARTVEVGNKINGKYQIINGINEGDEIVTNGGFLLDSESQLKTGMPTGQNEKGTKKNKEENNSMPGMKM